MTKLIVLFLVCVISYLIGNIPFSYILVKKVTGKDITKIGTGNIGAMNVRRATDSWLWFVPAVILDVLKGVIPVLVSFYLAVQFGFEPIFLKGISMIFSVVGHNYSISAYILTGKIKSGRGLATGGGALLVFNWVYAIFALILGLLSIFISKYLLAGQVITPTFLPVFVYFYNPKEFVYVLVVCLLVLIRHIPRIKTYIKGKEPKWNIKDYRQVDKD